VVILSNGFESNYYCLLDLYILQVSKTTTYYVRTSTGPDFSVRVPVVASVYSAPIGEFVCFAYGCRRM
jgi:hypothetical protein